MQKRSRWWIATSAAVAIAVAATTGVAVWQASNSDNVTVADPLAAPAQAPGIIPATGDTPLDAPALAAHLDELADNGDLGQLVGQVIDTHSGFTVWERGAAEPARPASTTKILTAAAALLAAGPDHILTTTVEVDPDHPDTVIIRAAGDVNLDQAQIDSLAEQIRAAGITPNAVMIDTSVWAGPDFREEWDTANIAEGFIAPMQPAMIHGARIGGTTGDLPRSTTPALDVAHALADSLGIATFGMTQAPDTLNEDNIVAHVDSDPLTDRLRAMMLVSDNVAAEATGREIAIAAGQEPSIDGAAKATLDVLTGHGFDTSGVTLVDNSGLSDSNNIPPRLLTQILAAAADDHQLRPLLDTLPVAGATGTLTSRFAEDSGRGWVRAKTGTLTTTSALAGTVTGSNGHIYAFAFISNDSSVLPARAALDKLASGLRD